MDINLFWIIVIIVFIFLMRITKNKVLKKVVGSFLIVGGLFMFNPIPSIDDTILFPLFSSVLPYSFITAGLGLAIAYTGIWISGLKLIDLKNKIKRMFK